jgi:hypothetical protein
VVAGLPASASGFDTHRDSVTSLFDCRGWAENRREELLQLPVLSLRELAAQLGVSDGEELRREWPPRLSTVHAATQCVGGWNGAGGGALIGGAG